MLWPPATVGRACRRQHAAKSTCTWRNWLLARTITHAPLAAKEIIATTRPDHQLAGLHTHVHVLFSTRSPRGAQSAAFVHAHVCRILWRRAMRVAVMTNHGRADARRQGATDARPCGNQVLGPSFHVWNPADFCINTCDFLVFTRFDSFRRLL